MSFSKVIEDKIDILRDEQEALKKEILMPDFHIQRMVRIVEDIIPQVHALDLSGDELKTEFTSVLRQVPLALQEGWTSHTARIRDIDNTIERHSEMRELYLSWEAEQELKAAADARARKDIESGAIEEPSTKTGRKRKFGQRPPITLGRYRRLAEPEDGEDQ